MHREVILSFSREGRDFSEEFFSLFGKVSKLNRNGFELFPSDTEYFPRVLINPIGCATMLCALIMWAISGHAAIGYERIRRPKIELVSFGKCSNPLMLFDASYAWAQGSISNPVPGRLIRCRVGQCVVYVSNPFGMDPCLVLGSDYEFDWSSYFKGNRIIFRDHGKPI